MRRWFRYAVLPALMASVVALVMAGTPGGASAAPALDDQQAVRTEVFEFGFQVTEVTPDGDAVPAAVAGCGGFWFAQWTPLPQPVKPVILFSEATCDIPTGMASPGVRLFSGLTGQLLVQGNPFNAITTRANSTGTYPAALVGQTFVIEFSATFTATPGNIINAPGCAGSGTPQAFCQGAHGFTVT